MILTIPFPTSFVYSFSSFSTTCSVEKGLLALTGVGYEINDYTPPEDISKISATEIRKTLDKRK